MKPTTPVLAAVFAVSAAVAHADVTVKFIQPENYADMPFTRDGKDRVMDDLKRHFEKLGAKLPAGQDFKVEILDVDLAGRMEPTGRAAPDFRVLRGNSDWPMIKLRYSVESKGQVLKSGEARVADMSYLQQINSYTSSESLRYEKLMLDRWFKNNVIGSGS
jgi:Protein of unknown function (DUF3016)